MEGVGGGGKKGLGEGGGGKATQRESVNDPEEAAGIQKVVAVSSGQGAAQTAHRPRSEHEPRHLPFPAGPHSPGFRGKFRLCARSTSTAPS